MKPIKLIILLLMLSACAHETTTLDRELALKLADRPQVVMANNPAPIVNVNINSTLPNNSNYPLQQDLAESNGNCMESPTYNIDGSFDKYVKQCFAGGR